MQDRPDRPSRPSFTRRRFVGLVAAGSAAALASPLAAAAAASGATHARPAGPGTAPVPGGMTAADHTEFERQRKSTLDTLAVIRKHVMGPGTEMALVFRVVKPARRNG